MSVALLDDISLITSRWQTLKRQWGGVGLL